MSRWPLLRYRLFPEGQDETNCHFVSSRGLLKSCRIHRHRLKSDSKTPPAAHLARLRAHDSVYVSTRALTTFVTRVLPRLKRPFTLVTGDFDVGVNSQEISPTMLRAILENPFLEVWYAQNLSRTHVKQAHMPIGMDFHTLASRREHAWGSFRTPRDQERELLAAARAALPIAKKRPIGYCNWHFALDRGTRTKCLAQVDKTAMYFEAQPVPRAVSWATNAGMLFTISPTGRGIDCHRTWEAIALGTIPVVDRSALSPLFATLPVIEVDDWNTVTADFLNMRAVAMLQRDYDFAPLFLRYWTRRIAGEPPRSLVMDFQKFVDRGAEAASEALSRQTARAQRVPLMTS